MKTLMKRAKSNLGFSGYIKKGDIVETVTLTKDNYKEFANEYWKGYYSVSAENVEGNMVTVMAKDRKCSLPEWNFDFVEIGATYVKIDKDPLNPARGKTWGRILNVDQLEEVKYNEEI